MGRPTEERRIQAVGVLATIAQGEASNMDTWHAVELMLYISHLQGEVKHWADMYTREALRYANIRGAATKA